MGRRGQGQAGRRARGARRLGRPLSGRRQRRPHGGPGRHVVRAAPDSERDPAPRRSVRHRQRRRARSRNALYRDRRAGAPTAWTSRAGSTSATARTSCSRTTSWSTRAVPRATRSAPPAAESDRRTRTRSRAAACACSTCAIRILCVPMVEARSRARQCAACRVGRHRARIG